MFDVKPISKQRNAYEWYKYQNYIDMNPGYQRRGDLWPAKNQRLLINSMLNGTDIPKIYFADFTFGETILKQESKLYAVIDGKQRLSTIFKFFDDNLKLDSKVVIYKGEEYNLEGMTYSEIKERYYFLAQIIESFQLTIMSVFTDDLKYLREMFIRLNQNVSISGPEKRNALDGPLPIVTRDLAVHEFVVYHTTMNVSRGQDLNLIAKLLLYYSGDTFNTLGKSTLDAYFIKNSDRNKKEFSGLESRVSNILNSMVELFPKKDTLLSSQNMILLYIILSDQASFPKSIRDFLLSFENNRVEVNKLTKSNELSTENFDGNTADYVAFNQNYRSPDNLSSINIMLRVLKKMYAKWTINKGSIAAGILG